MARDLSDFSPKAPQSPLARYQELAGEVWDAIGRIRYRGSIGVNELSEITFLEGRVAGFAEALVLSRPELSKEAQPITRRLMDDLEAFRDSITKVNAGQAKKHRVCARCGAEISDGEEEQFGADPKGNPIYYCKSCAEREEA